MELFVRIFLIKPNQQLREFYITGSSGSSVYWKEKIGVIEAYD